MQSQRTESNVGAPAHQHFRGQTGYSVPEQTPRGTLIGTRISSHVEHWNMNGLKSKVSPAEDYRKVTAIQENPITRQAHNATIVTG